MSPILARFKQRRTAYLPLGLAGIVIAVLALVLGAGGRRLLGTFPSLIFAYALVTGSLLILAMLWQWRLYFARKTKDSRRIQREYRLHRWIGVVPVALLAAHVGGHGATLLSVMSYCLLVSSVTGVFNNEVVRQKSKLARKIWLATHLGFATFIIPIVILHIWTVFAFKGR